MSLSNPPKNEPINKTENSLSNIRLSWVIFTLIIFIGLLKLGVWQNHRAAEKEQRLVKMSQLSKQEAVSLAQVVALSSIEQSENINDFPVVVTGSFNENFVFLLDNQVNTNSLGYRVYQVVETKDYAVLVNLGWIQGSINRLEIPDVTPLSGEFSFKGHVRYIEAGIMLMEQKFEGNQWPLRVQQIELTKFSKLINKKLLPFVVYLDKNEQQGYVKNWQPIVMPPEKHRAYAFQWFSLAIAWLLLMMWVSGILVYIADKFKKKTSELK